MKEQEKGLSMEKKKDHYEHVLSETCCDLCKKKVMAPVFFKVDATWFMWFFCSTEHRRAFSERNVPGLRTIQ